jgi:hypothetical protein
MNSLSFFLHRLLVAAGIMATGLSGLPAADADDEGDSAFALPERARFNRDIRTIFSKTCFACHGPDSNARKAKLRLDIREEAILERDGIRPIVPGNAAASEAYRRIMAADPDDQMPPADFHTQLSPRDKAMLKQWIDQGADYEKHWAFIPPVRPQPSEVEHAEAVRNPIDAFVIARLAADENLPAKEARRRTLVRRVTLDLTGLPPATEEVEAFVADPANNNDAYERLVDRLLDSPRFGEHQARYWLDAARYADTSGYQYDKIRHQWVWRDWVIHAFNTNMPFDRFTIEQNAGDLLPNATGQTRLATGFHRNHPITIEGGVIDEEYRTEYVMDRVVTTSTTWLGLTFGCARCHDHKYDPIGQSDFYSFFAFFNNVPERGLNGFKPQEKIESPLKNLDAQSAGANADVPETMILTEKPKPRQAYVLMRGEYDKPVKDRPVEPNVPVALGGLPSDLPRNRLGLAKWLVSEDNPLTARVTVNRFWAQLFGTGIVKTIEDFGSQGEYPSHPDLLDWLAVEFVQSGWDIKHLFKTMVMSGTYRQSSQVTSDLQTLDPNNRLLARGPRFRLDAETIRDAALAVSGQLDETIGGPGVYPYHPQGLWLEINNRPGYSRAYPHTEDPAQLYRRSMYTFWKRTVPPPSLATFDAPEREYCVVQRSRTNTPLQAFVMLHDPQFVEAARKLAERMIHESDADPDQRIAHGFQLCTARQPTERESALLRRALHDRLVQYQSDKDAAAKLLSIGQSTPDSAIDPAELAAYATIARMLLNLSEFITKG